MGQSFTMETWIALDYYWLNSGSFEPTYFQMKDERLHFTVCSIWICVFYPPHVSYAPFNLK